jgi:hypothetical protein
VILVPVTTDRKLLIGKLLAGNGRAAADPGLVRSSGLAGDGVGYAALVMVTAKPSASICRMWF